MDEATPLSRFRAWLNLDSQILRRVLHPVQSCYLCDLPVAQGQGLCGGCVGDLARRDPFTAPGKRIRERAVDAWLVPFEYAFPLDRMIRQAKFRRDLAALNACRLLLENEVSKHLHQLPECPLLLPVPLSPWRFVARGFNQSAALAGAVASASGGRRHDRLASRRGYQPAQSSLRAADRARNVRDRFRIHQRLDGAHVVVVDDVITTGATATELAMTLRRAGAGAITVVALAATP